MPAVDRVDRRQLGALLRLQLGHILRPGVDASSGARSRPIVQLTLSMGFFGLLLSLSAFRATDPDAFLSRLFVSAAFLIALTIVPEAEEARERQRELLWSKPISTPTFWAARGIALSLVATLVAVSYGLLPIAVTIVRFGLPPWLIVAELAALAVGAISLALLWFHVLLASVPLLGAERVRGVSQTLLVVALAGIVLFSMLSAEAWLESVLGLSARRALPWLPPVWYALFATSAGAAQRLGAIALTGAAFLAFRERRLVPYYERLTRYAPAPRRLVVPGSVHLLEAFARWAGARGRNDHRSAAVIASAIIVVTRREEISRVRGFVMQILATGFFAWSLVADDPTLPLFALAYASLAAAVEGVQVARQSADPGAAWLFVKMPVSPRVLGRAFVWAVFARFALWPLGLALIGLSRHHGPLMGVALWCVLALVARLLLLATLAIEPSLPLAREPRASGAFVSQLLGAVLITMALVGFALITLTASLLAHWGLILVGLVLLALAAAGLAMRLLAEFRLEGVRLGSQG